MQLFSEPKVEVFLDLGAFGTEKKKRHEEQKVMKIAFHIALSPEVCSAFVPDDGQIKASVFSTVDGHLRPFWRSSTWHLFPPAQRMEAYATPDSEVPTIVLDHVKISKVVRAKMVGAQSAVLILNAIVADCGPEEREAIAAWHRTQRWVTFYESDSTLSLTGDALTESDEKARAPHLAPMWDDPPLDSRAIGDLDVRDIISGNTPGQERAAALLDEIHAEKGGHRYPDTSKKRKQRRDKKAHDEKVATSATESDEDEEQPDQVM